ncbi:hypothetical protein DSO57_1001753 [Entomophthora muscae]|uniref:Uncharacterized protein n=1 Tax=Entomophthora muscae TaxID=34485 RepID=A0ACC2T8U9_9FUNG|nr:hypothetical protein DSO57_1001753 [Entomophthora muscae]
MLVVNHQFYVDLGETASYYPVISVITAEDFKFCLDYSQFESELMATGNNCDTRHHAIISLLDIRQGSHNLQAYTDKFLKLKARNQLEDKLSAILYR